MLLGLFSSAVIWGCSTVSYMEVLDLLMGLSASCLSPLFAFLFTPFSSRCGAIAGGTRLPTSFLYDFSTERMWVYFSFPSSSSGAITQHCFNSGRHKGCVLARLLQRGFAMPALLARFCECADGPLSLVWMVIIVDSSCRSSHSL